MSKLPDLSAGNPVSTEQSGREMPQVNSSGGRPGVNKKLVIIVASALAMALILIMFMGGDDNSNKKTSKTERVQSNLPPIPPMPKKEEAKPAVEPKKEAKPAPVMPAPVPVAQGGKDKKEITPEQRKLMSSNMVFGGKEQQDGQVSTAPRSAKGPDSDLAKKVTATQLIASQAGILAERSYFITAGQFLDCVLESAIDSTVSGMVRAVLSRDVYGADGKVLLLDKGTRLIGEYRGGLKQGEARLFVLWTRAETPEGVIIQINSPGADPLGRSGLDGYIDTHFFERFGAALMFSLIDDTGKYLIDRLAEWQSGNSGNNNSQSIDFTSSGETTKDAAGIILEHSINIPPTLHKNQGDPISIYIARDLDFSTVYKLEVE